MVVRLQSVRQHNVGQERRNDRPQLVPCSPRNQVSFLAQHMNIASRRRGIQGSYYHQNTCKRILRESNQADVRMHWREVKQPSKLQTGAAILVSTRNQESQRSAEDYGAPERNRWAYNSVGSQRPLVGVDLMCKSAQTASAVQTGHASVKYCGTP